MPTPGELGESLERAGLERFLGKSAQFEGELAGHRSEEVLYLGALRAMGYTANTAGFEQLGAALSFEAVRAAVSTPAAASAEARSLTVQAALLGAGGLLPSQRGLPDEDGWPERLERAWADVAPAVGAPLPRSAWRWCQPGTSLASTSAILRTVTSASLQVCQTPGERKLEDLTEPSCAP